jgi:ABC-type xylose transport system permease subunit
MGRGSLIVPLLLFSVAALFVVFGTLHLLGVPFDPAHVLPVAWFTLLTAITHTWLERGADRDPKGFVTRYMAVQVVKMLSSLMLVVLLLLALPKERGVPMALVFVGLYLMFLAFSTVRLSSRLKAPTHAP